MTTMKGKAAKVVLGLVLVVAVVRPAFTAIKGTDHDFSSQNWSSGQICIVCHTPHNASVNPSAPLWNHALTAATYTPFSSASLNAEAGQPSGLSKSCLSCHDGTVALDSYGGATGKQFISGSGKLGTDLSNDHPVSIGYDAASATADGGLYDPTVKTVAALGDKTIDAGMLRNHRLECSSCHDVHANKGDSPTASGLLLVGNSGSALCLTCHNK